MTPELPNPQQVTLMAGMLYALLAVTVWVMLHRRHHALAVGLWSAGSLTLALGLILVGLRGALPDWASLQLANHLLLWSMTLRLWALRHDLGLPLRVGPLTVLTVAGMLLFQLSLLAQGQGPRTVVATLQLSVGCLALAWHAYRAGVSTPSRSGRLLAWAEIVAAATLLLRMASVLAIWPATVTGTVAGQFALLLVMAAFAAIYSNLGYLGVVLDRLAASESRARQAQEAALSGRDDALRQTEALRNLLAQRNQLVAERDHLLGVLAHEIRQPVHNACGALQAAATALHANPSLKNQAATEPLQLAQTMLGHMQSVLDNALAGAVLLTRSAPLATQDVDLDVLVELALGDLPPAQREQVRVEWQTTLRTAELEPGLVRLALRNLLRNAFAHGGPGVGVQLRLAESAHPPRLTMSVLDTGRGASAANLAASIAWTGDDASTGPLPTRGMGLFIARRVMARHGGELQLAANEPRGLVASLVFSLPAEDDEAALVHH